MATDLEKLMLTHYTDNQIHVTPEQRYLLDQGIGDLIDGYTVIQSDLAQVDTILANAIASESVYAGLIDVELLEANKILAAAIEATYLYANHMDAEVANVTSLFANYATIENLTAQRAEIDTLLAEYIRADDIIANNLKASQILADAAEIGTLLSYSISTEGLASIRVTSDQLVVADGFINDAMIMDLSANKIKSGSIYTNLVNIVSESGNLGIMDNTIQIKDDMDTTRVQIGKDADADYSMYVWDAAGNLMFDATGLHADGIKHPIIRDDMVSDLANISGHKLNIESVITEINDGSTTLKSSKIYFDEDDQTLDVKLGSITSLVGDTASEVSTLRTDVQVAQGSINTIISEVDLATIEGLGTSFYEQYNTTKSTVDSWEVSLGNQETTFPGLINSVKTNNAKISATPEAISAVLTSEYMDGLDTIQAMKSSISLNQGAIEAKVSKNGVIAAINLDPGIAKIQASKIKLEGVVTANSRFKILTDGSMVATNADITGSITSTNAIITGGYINIETASETYSRIRTAYSEWVNESSPLQVKLTNTSTNTEAIIQASGVWLKAPAYGKTGSFAFNTGMSTPGFVLDTDFLYVDNRAEVEDLRSGSFYASNNAEVGGDLRVNGSIIGISDSDLPLQSIVHSSGSDARGEWIRFGNGVQICWWDTELNYSTNVTLERSWTYPVPFYEAPALFGNSTESSTVVHRALAIHFANVTSSRCDTLMSRVTGSTDFTSSDSRRVSLMAIGTWAWWP